MGRPVVVVTHSVPDGWPREEAPFTFATDGIESAIEKAKALAGETAIAAVVAKRGAGHVECCCVHGCVCRVSDEDELGLPVDVAADQPRACGSVDVYSGAGDPLHRDLPDRVGGWTVGAASSAIASTAA